MAFTTFETLVDLAVRHEIFIDVATHEVNANSIDKLDTPQVMLTYWDNHKAFKLFERFLNRCDSAGVVVQIYNDTHTIHPFYWNGEMVDASFEHNPMGTWWAPVAQYDTDGEYYALPIVKQDAEDYIEFCTNNVENRALLDIDFANYGWTKHAEDSELFMRGATSAAIDLLLQLEINKGDLRECYDTLIQEKDNTVILWIKLNTQTVVHKIDAIVFCIEDLLIANPNSDAECKMKQISACLDLIDDDSNLVGNYLSGDTQLMQLWLATVELLNTISETATKEAA